MNRPSIMAAFGVCLSLAPLALSGASADSLLPAAPAHKTPTFFNDGDERRCLAAQAQSGAFLEMTAAAP